MEAAEPSGRLGMFEFEAYAIHGNNFVKLRDIGRAVDFGVAYDGAANSVQISPDTPYAEEADDVPAAPSVLTEENVRAAIMALKERYPNNTLYPAPYLSSSGGPYGVSSTYCAGWATLCSDTVFGNLPWRKISKPDWSQIRVGDLIRYDNNGGGHVVVVIDKTEEYLCVTESGTHNKAIWGGQYFKWWLEQQPGYTLLTRYPK